MKVAVVGAGAAGLAAAYDLFQAGAEVEVFEARNRIGGRIWTPRPGCEAGAEWIDDDHCRTLALARQLGVAVAPGTPAGSEYALIHGGRRIEPEDARRLRAEVEAKLDPDRVARIEFVQDFPLADWLDRELPDPQTRWLAEAVIRSDEGEDTRRIGFHGWQWGLRHYRGRGEGAASAWRVPAGMADLPAAMAARLPRPVQTGKALASVEQASGNVVLEFSDGSCGVYERAILAVPPASLRRVRLTPSIERGRASAWRAAATGRLTKTLLRFLTPWWEAEGWHGYLMADAAYQQIWPEPWAEEPTLCAYTCGDDSVSLDGPQDVLGALAESHPAAQEEYLGGTQVAWAEDALAGGGFSYLPPGFLVRHRDWMRRPLGRIHFAGEHAAEWQGFVEGAIESGQRAAAEVLAA